MVPMQKGFNNLQSPECNNMATGALVGGFVTGVSITLALIGLFTKVNK